MRILYLDIDSLRPDHLGCYGYMRQTSPHIDSIAARGARFTNCYVSDAPCLPSRTALMSGRCGYQTGVVNHGGIAAQPFPEADRAFQDSFRRTSWMSCLRRAGFHTAAISPFGERHSAWWWYAGFNEIFNTGKSGGETADEIEPLALDWIHRNGARDHWFLHLNLWDAHTPYRTPEGYGNPFENEPYPDWITESVRQKHWNSCGPHSAREVNGWGGGTDEEGLRKYARQPHEIASQSDVRRMFDGYDTGVKYADDTVGRLLHLLDELGVRDQTAIVISADHGENLGELNIYGDHQTADAITTRVPLIIDWPGVTNLEPGRVDEALHLHLDYAATVIELAGAEVPENWGGQSFAASLRAENEATNATGREALIVSQMAWSCQRGVRFNHENTAYHLVRTFHDGFHAFPDVMLFDLDADPHQQHDLAPARPDLVDLAQTYLQSWQAEMDAKSPHGDPMQTVLSEGGPFHGREGAMNYVQRLRETGRDNWADILSARHLGDG